MATWTVLDDAHEQTVEPLRTYGVYAAVVPGRGEDDDVSRLLRYLGRDPHWKA